MAVLGALAVAGAIALALVTSALHDVDVRLAMAVERVRLVLELESHVLQRSGPRGAAADPDTLKTILAELQRRADRELTEDIRAIETRLASLARATTPDEADAQLGQTVALLRSLVSREEAEAQRATASAATWDRLANLTGITIAVALVIGVAATLTWLWRRAFRPLVGVAAAIERFARGERQARAPEEGAGELRQIAVSFNEMAAALGRQHEQQLAFVGGVAHDLRNPLNTLKLAVAMLEREPQRSAAVADRIVRQVDRLERMVGDLLDSSRIEAGHLELRPTVIDVRGVVARIVDGQRAASTTRTYELSVPDAPVHVRIDVLRIEQVLNNLLSNAAKYSPEFTAIEVALEHDGTTATISVTDHGVGIHTADLARILEPFRRGENVGRIGGAGLGLSVTRRIVEAHGGRVEVRSEPGVGSAFSVRLPEVFEAAGAEHGVAEIRNYSG